jgi:hypothetical protein
MENGILRDSIIAASLLLSAALYTGWAMNEACSTYRGTFRPADMVCDVPYGRELDITVAHRLPVQAPPSEQSTKRAICRTSGENSWQLACDLPSGRELIINLSPRQHPRVKCKLFVDCPARY